jgi:hypothetical protein
MGTQNGHTGGWSNSAAFCTALKWLARNRAAPRLRQRLR